jgi:hypothetical protein
MNANAAIKMPGKKRARILKESQEGSAIKVQAREIRGLLNPLEIYLREKVFGLKDYSKENDGSNAGKFNQANRLNVSQGQAFRPNGFTHTMKISLGKRLIVFNAKPFVTITIVFNFEEERVVIVNIMTKLAKNLDQYIPDGKPRRGFLLALENVKKGVEKKFKAHVNLRIE